MGPCLGYVRVWAGWPAHLLAMAGLGITRDETREFRIEVCKGRVTGGIAWCSWLLEYLDGRNGLVIKPETMVGWVGVALCLAVQCMKKGARAC